MMKTRHARIVSNLNLSYNITNPRLQVVKLVIENTTARSRKTSRQTLFVDPAATQVTFLETVLSVNVAPILETSLAAPMVLKAELVEETLSIEKWNNSCKNSAAIRPRRVSPLVLRLLLVDTKMAEIMADSVI